MQQVDITWISLTTNLTTIFKNNFNSPLMENPVQKSYLVNSVHISCLLEFLNVRDNSVIPTPMLPFYVTKAKQATSYTKLN